MDSDCLFCKIVTGEMPSDQVTSNGEAVAFVDIDPQAPTHILVVPKRHIVDADHLEPSDSSYLAAMFDLAGKVAALRGLSPQAGGGGFRLVLNAGADALNSVPHLHMHVLGGRAMTWPPG